MRKLMIIMLFIPVVGFGQELAPKKAKKQVKERIIASGVLIIGGSVASFVKSRQNEPEFQNYTDSNKYAFDKKNYNTKQRDLQIVSSFLYGMSGVSIISISFNF